MKTTLFALLFCFSSPLAMGAPLTQQQQKLLNKTVDPNAEALDCPGMRKKVMARLKDFRAENNSVNRECESNLKARANTVSEGGVCQNTYKAIAGIADGIESEVGKFCQQVNEAKEWGKTCKSQEDCISGTQARYDRAAKTLEELVAQMAKGKEKLKIAREENKQVADLYSQDLAYVSSVLAEKKDLSTITKPLDSFGMSASELFDYYQWKPVAEIPEASVADYRRAFDNRPETTFNEQQIGKHIDEQWKAYDKGGKMIDITTRMQSTITGFQEQMLEATSKLGKASTNLGELPPGKEDAAPTGLSSISKAPRRDGGLTPPSASKMIDPELFAALAGTKAPDSKVGEPAPIRALASSPEPSASAPSSAPSSKLGNTDSKVAQVGTSETGSSKKDEENEIVKNFGAIGDGKVALSEAGELNALRASVDLTKRALAGSGAAAAMIKQQMGKDGTNLNSIDAANSGDRAAQLARGGKAYSGSIAKEEDPKALHHKGADVNALREMLRRKLAERGANGEDVNASRTVDEIMENMAKHSEAADGAQTEQGALPGVESAPLFRRVHDAHQRFEARSSPHQAGL